MSKSEIAKNIRDNTTVLQDLLFWIESFEDMPIKPTYINMKEKIWQLLPKERKQFIDAYARGNVKENDLIVKSAEQYYNLKFKDNETEPK
jgi:uncharacterized protein YjaZ